MERRTSEAARLRRSEILAALFIAAFLLPNLATLVVPFEKFPYSSAPMFAHYVAEEVPRYRFRFMAETAGGGEERELKGAQIGLRHVDLSRYFFGSVYGSIDPLSPFGHHRDESREAFEARLSRFFGDFARVLGRRDPEAARGLAGIRLELVRLGDQPYGEIRVVGRYDVAADRFTHSWGGRR